MDAIVPKPLKNGMIDPNAPCFALDLSAAAERLTAARCAREPLAFCYAGTDLRYAAERWLYFSSINDDALFASYCRSRMHPNSAPPPELSPTAASLFPFFDIAADHKETKRFSVANALGQLARRHMHKTSTRRRGVIVKHGALNSGGIIFQVSHRKFLTYLAPIAARLNVPTSWLVIDDLPLFEELAEAGHTIVHVESDPNTEPRSYLSETLKDWSLVWTVDALRETLGDLTPRCVVIPEGNSHTNEVLNRVARSMGIRTVCVQQGWSPLIHSGFRNMSYSSMCVWGSAFAKALQPYNPKQHFAVTGNHVMRFRDPSDASQRKTVGFFAQKGARLITAEAWRAFLDLARWASVTFPEMTIVMREHPGAPISADDIARLGDAPNLILAPPSDVPLDALLAECRVVVSVFSTTLLEGMAAGAVPLIVNVTGMNRYNPDLAAIDAGVEVHDFDEARRALSSLLGEPRATHNYSAAILRAREEFFVQDAELAVRALARVISATS